VAERAKVVHAIPGRVRVKVPQLRANRALGRRVDDRLSVLPGVRRVDVNPVTGSLLVEYDPAVLDLAASLMALEELSPELSDLGLDGDGMAGLAAWLTRPHNGAAERTTPEAGLRTGAGGQSLLPFSLAALGVGRLLSGNRVLPQWYDLIWFAFSIHHLLNRRDGGPPGAGESSAG
jgi:heavy-metal-associated domain-containing protein